MPGDREAFVATYGPLFEHSPWVAEDAYANGPYADREALYDGLVEAMYAAPRERQVALVRAHPDLAGKAAIAVATATAWKGIPAADRIAGLTKRM